MARLRMTCAYFLQVKLWIQLQFDAVTVNPYLSETGAVRYQVVAAEHSWFQHLGGCLIRT